MNDHNHDDHYSDVDRIHALELKMVEVKSDLYNRITSLEAQIAQMATREELKSMQLKQTQTIVGIFTGLLALGIAIIRLF